MVNKKQPLFVAVEKKIGYSFSEPEIIRRALTHRSVQADLATKNELHNETLEFLGDAVLSMIAAEALFRETKHGSEGDLSRMRADYVCKDNLVAAAHRLGIIDHMVVSRSLRMSGVMGSSKILSDVLEALIGAVYIDGGLDAAKRSVELMLGPLPKLAQKKTKDAKTSLQEKVQQLTTLTPIYEVHKAEGPPHMPIFFASVKVGDVILANSRGKSKKDATLECAAEALKKIEMLTEEALKGWLISGELGKDI